MGRSGSGKSYVLNNLFKQPAIAKWCRVLKTYTARPRRVNERNSMEYNFLDDIKDFEGLNIIEKRAYVIKPDTIWEYYTCSNNIVPSDTYYIGIGTPESSEKIRQYYYNIYKKDVVVPIYIEASDINLLINSISRINADCHEICRRFLADEEDFSLEKLSEAYIDDHNTFINTYSQDSTDIIKDISLYIMSTMLDNEKAGE